MQIRRSNYRTAASLVLATASVLVLLLLLLAAAVVPTTAAAKNKSRSIADWKYRTIYQLLTDRYAKPSAAASAATASAFKNNGTSTATFDCDLHDYCGGTYRGMIQKLDYIQDLGFNAVCSCCA